MSYINPWTYFLNINKGAPNQINMTNCIARSEKPRFSTLPPIPESCSCKDKLENENYMNSANTTINNLGHSSCSCLDNRFQTNQLYDREKQIKCRIKENEQNKQACRQILQHANNMKNGAIQNQNHDNRNIEDKHDDLSKEYTKIGKEMENTNLELNHCLDQVNKPLLNRIEDRRRKTEQLQDDLRFVLSTLDTKICPHAQNLTTLQKQLNCTCRNFNAAKITNEQLNQDMYMLQNKYKKLQKDIEAQKMIETRTTQTLNDAMGIKQAMGDHKEIRNKHTRHNFEDDNLEELARRISRSLLEIEKCHECKTKLPEDLKETVMGIKHLLDLIHRHKLKQEKQVKSLLIPSASSKEHSKPAYELKINTSTTTSIPSDVDVTISSDKVTSVIDETETEIRFTSSVQALETVSQTSVEVEFETRTSTKKPFLKELAEESSTKIQSVATEVDVTIESRTSSITSIKSVLLTNFKQIQDTVTCTSSLSPTYKTLSTVEPIASTDAAAAVFKECEISSKQVEDIDGDITTVEECKELQKQNEISCSNRITLEEHKSLEKVEGSYTIVITVEERNKSEEKVNGTFIAETAIEAYEKPEVEKTSKNVITVKKRESLEMEAEDVRKDMITVIEHEKTEKQTSDEGYTITTLKEYKKLQEEFEVTSKQEALNVIDVGVVERESNLDDKHINIIIKTESGNLEIVTASGDTAVESIITYSKSGNVNITTEIIEYNDEAFEKFIPESELDTSLFSTSHIIIAPMAQLSTENSSVSNPTLTARHSTDIITSEETRYPKVSASRDVKYEEISMEIESKSEISNGYELETILEIEEVEIEKVVNKQPQSEIKVLQNKIGEIETKTAEAKEQTSLEVQIEEKKRLHSKTETIELVIEATNTQEFQFSVECQSLEPAMECKEVHVESEMLENYAEELDVVELQPVVERPTLKPEPVLSVIEYQIEVHVESEIFEIPENDAEILDTESDIFEIPENIDEESDLEEIISALQCIDYEMSPPATTGSLIKFKELTSKFVFDENQDEDNQNEAEENIPRAAVFSPKSLESIDYNCNNVCSRVYRNKLENAEKQMTIFSEDSGNYPKEYPSEKSEDEITFIDEIQHQEFTKGNKQTEQKLSSKTKEEYEEEMKSDLAEIFSSEKITRPSLLDDKVATVISVNKDPFIVENISKSDLHKNVEEALEKTNKLATDTLHQTHLNITEALEKVNKTAESILASAVKEKPTKVNTQVATEEEFFEHLTILESISTGRLSKMIPLQDVAINVKEKKNEEEQQKIDKEKEIKKQDEDNQNGRKHWGGVYEKEVKGDIPRTPVFVPKALRSTGYDCNDVCGRMYRKKLNDEEQKTIFSRDSGEYLRRYPSEESEDKTTFIREIQWQEFTKKSKQTKQTPSSKTKKEYEEENNSDLSDIFLSDKITCPSLFDDNVTTMLSEKDLVCGEITERTFSITTDTVVQDTIAVPFLLPETIEKEEETKITVSINVEKTAPLGTGLVVQDKVVVPFILPETVRKDKEPHIMAEETALLYTSIVVQEEISASVVLPETVEKEEKPQLMDFIGVDNTILSDTSIVVKNKTDTVGKEAEPQRMVSINAENTSPLDTGVVVEDEIALSFLLPEIVRKEKEPHIMAEETAPLYTDIVVQEEIVVPFILPETVEEKEAQLMVLTNTKTSTILDTGVVVQDEVALAVLFPKTVGTEEKLPLISINAEETTPLGIDIIVHEEVAVPLLFTETVEKQTEAQPTFSISAEKTTPSLQSNSIVTDQKAITKPDSFTAQLIGLDKPSSLRNSREGSRKSQGQCSKRSRKSSERGELEVKQETELKNLVIKISPLEKIKCKDVCRQSVTNKQTSTRKRSKSSSEQKSDSRDSTQSSRKPQSAEEGSKRLDLRETKEGKSKSLQVPRSPQSKPAKLKEGRKADRTADVHTFEPRRLDIKCDCKECECKICSPEKMKKKEEKRKAAKLDNPNECTCLPDCGCAVCSSFASNLKVFGEIKPSGDATDQQVQLTKEVTEIYNKHKAPQQHPPDCECLDCLCDPPISLKNITELRHPEQCDCLLCTCCTCCSGPDEKTKSKFLPAACLYEQCSVVTDTLPTSTISNVVSDSRILLTESVTKKLSIVQMTYSLIASKDSKNLNSDIEVISLLHDSTNHSVNCDCFDCLKTATSKTRSSIKNADHGENCNCSQCLQAVCTTPTEEIGKGNIIDIDSLETDSNDRKQCSQTVCPIPIEEIEKEKVIDSLETEFIDLKQTIVQLQETIKQTGCIVRVAEDKALHSTAFEKSFVAVQKSSFLLTMSGLKLALCALQDKCKKKDQMIATITNELRLRTNNAILDDLIGKLSTENIDDSLVDYDRTEICNSLPRPTCDPQHRRSGDQLKEPIECRPCLHLDNPKSSCTINANRIASQRISILQEADVNKNLSNEIRKSFAEMPSSRSSSEYAIALDSNSLSHSSWERSTKSLKSLNSSESANLPECIDSSNILLCPHETKNRSIKDDISQLQLQPKCTKQPKPVEEFSKTVVSVPECFKKFNKDPPCSECISRRKSLSRENKKLITSKAENSPKPACSKCGDIYSPNLQQMKNITHRCEKHRILSSKPKESKITKQEQQVHDSYHFKDYTSTMKKYTNAEQPIEWHTRHGTCICHECSHKRTPSPGGRKERKEIHSAKKKFTPSKKCGCPKHIDTLSVREQEVVTLIQRALGWPKYGIGYLNPKMRKA